MPARTHLHLFSIAYELPLASTIERGALNTNQFHTFAYVYLHLKE
jgi:hypothetical protein